MGAEVLYDSLCTALGDDRLEIGARPSDGRDGHPVKRGMWLFKNLFDETPPPNVPELNREKPDDSSGARLPSQ